MIIIHIMNEKRLPNIKKYKMSEKNYENCQEVKRRQNQGPQFQRAIRRHIKKQHYNIIYRHQLCKCTWKNKGRLPKDH